MRHMQHRRVLEARAFVDFVHTLVCADHRDVPTNRMFFQAGHHMERAEHSDVWVILRLDNGSLRPFSISSS